MIAIILALVVLLCTPIAGLALELENTRANRARGVVGCIQSTTGITCPGKREGGSSGGFAGGSFEEQLLGAAFSSVMQGFMQSMQDRTQQQESDLRRQQELERARKALAEELARREREREELERRAREDFDRERDTAYSLLKGPKPSEILGLKGVVDPAEMGIKDIAPADFRRNVSTAWKRLHCSSYLSNKAEAAAKSGNEGEAAYLSEQAGQVMSGGNLEVQCPEAPVPPSVAVPEGDPLPEPPQGKFYTALMKSVKNSFAQLIATNEQIKVLQAKKDEAARKVQEQQEEVARLQQMPPVEPGTSAPEPRVVDEAQRLLEEAIQDEAEATNGLGEATQRQLEITQGIKKKETLFQKVKSDPMAAAELLPRVLE